jgi:3-hydroxybutyryl-CoA dehydrogenase
MEVKKIAVIGAGLMGAGIAQVAAQAGYEVKLMDIETRFLDKGMATIDKNLERMVGKGKLDSDPLFGRGCRGRRRDH